MIAVIPMLLALSPAPTAIIDSAYNAAGLEALQLLHPGATLDLGVDGRVRLAYFASCVHETVRGGRLRVGVTASITVEGEVERVTGDCDPPVTSKHSRGVLGALVLRNHGPLVPPVLRVRTETPIIITRPGMRIAMRRVEPPGHQVFLTADNGRASLSTLNIKLDRDALYEVCALHRCARVWVDPGPAHDHGPVLERVIHIH